MTRWLRRVLRRPPTIADCLRAAREACCDPLPDPYHGIVKGPELVDRTRWNHAQHEARWGDDAA